MSKPRLEGIEVLRLRLPLVAPWRTAHGSMVERDVVLVRAVLAGVEGWGECVALPEPTYSPEYTDGALEVLDRHLLPRLFAAGVTGGADVSPALAGVKGHPMAKSALEMAVLDAELRASGTPLARHLCAQSAGATEPAARVVAGAAVGIPAPPTTPSSGAATGIASRPPTRSAGGTAAGFGRRESRARLEALLEAVAGRVAEHHRRVKLKVQPGWDVEPVAAVRAAFGPDLLLQVDANGAYSRLADPFAALAPLDAHGLVLVEQPLGDDDLLGHAALARRLVTPVCLDESVTSAAVAGTAMELGSCSVVNVKAARVGGYLEAVRVHDRCRARSVPVWCGGMLETGVGRSANLALAALPNFTLPGDISGTGSLFSSDVITEPIVVADDGTIAVPDAAGIGVTVRDDVIATAAWSRWYRPGGR